MAKEEGIAEALETMLYSNDNQEYREAMTSYEMAERDRASDLEANLEKGIGIGLEKGREEEATAIVLHMLGQGVEVATIAKLSGISLKSVQAIVNGVTN